MTPSLKTESASEADQAQSPDSVATAGQLLREARLKVGMHLAVLSVTLKVPVRQLEALEADELDLAKGPVFYRGLASSMCRHLQIDAAPILALLPHASAQLRPLPSTIQPLQSKGSGVISGLPWGRMVSSKVFWGAALMLLLTGAFLWLPNPAQWTWLDDVKSLMADEVVSQEVTESMAQTPAYVAVEPSTSVEASTAAVTTSADAAPSAPVAAAPAAALNPQVQPAPLVKPATNTPAAAAVLSDAAPEWVFSATGESWLEVRNAQKAVVWSGLVKAGESIRIQNPLPVSVVVGRAQVVTVTLRGQPFDLKPYTQVTVARFEVKE